MLKGRLHTLLSKRWRLRLKAGALALVFAVYALLPWFHVMTAGSDHAGHGCGCQVASEDAVRGAPAALAVQAADTADSCWVCQSLISLLQHNDRTDAAALIRVPLLSTYVARASHAPVALQIFPAHRAQAPPVHA